MIHIKTVRLREIHLPLREPFVTSVGVRSNRRILLVEMTDTDGVTGWSECVAPEYPDYTSETVDTAWLALCKWLAPLVLGIDLDGPESVFSRLRSRVRGHRMAKAAVEMAVWELEARRRGVSLSGLLGGTRRTIAAGVAVGILADERALVARVETFLREGYRRIKIKVKPGVDVRPVAALREAFGDDLPLAVDANASYASSDRVRSLDGFGLLMIEQPLGYDDLLRHADLQRELNTPVCLDESIASPERTQDMIRLQSARIVNVKPGRVGGFSEARAIHDLCAEHGIPVWCGGMLESGIGRAHGVALSSLPNFRLPADLSPSSRYWERDVVTPEWTMAPDGTVAVPVDRVGMGVDVDVNRIEDLTRRSVILPG